MFRITSDNIIYILSIILCSFFIIFESRNGIIPIIIIVLLILFLHLKKESWKYKIYCATFHLLVFIFSFYCMLTSIWAYDSVASFKTGIAIIKVLFIISILYNYYVRKNSIKELLNCIIWAGNIITFYSFYYYGINKVFKYLVTNERLENGYANVNSIGMFLAFTILVSFFQFVYIYKKIIFRNIFNIFSFLLIITTGSRKAVAILLIGIFLITLSKYLKKNIVLNILRIIIIIIFTIIILKIILSLQIFNGINERMEGLIALLTQKGKINYSTFLRQEYIKLGIKLFKDNFLFGIGMDNTYLTTYVIENKKTYLHNNYIEILAGGGIIGFSLFYSMYVYLILKFYKYRKIWDIYSKFCIILLLLLLLIQYGSVEYYYKSTYFYLMIFFIEINRLKKKIYKEKKQCLKN